MKKIIVALFLFASMNTNATELGNTPFIASRLLYTGQVTTSVWTQVLAGVPYTISKISIFDSSGQTLKLGIGAAGSETDMHVIVFPGGNGNVNVNIPPNTRISIKALSATAASGELDINYSI